MKKRTSSAEISDQESLRKQRILIVTQRKVGKFPLIFTQLSFKESADFIFTKILTITL